MRRSGSKAGAANVDRTFKAIGDPHRIQILHLLQEREMSAGEILGALDIVQSTLSHHMKILVEAELVSAVRKGKWTIYTLQSEQLLRASDALQELASARPKDAGREDGSGREQTQTTAQERERDEETEAAVQKKPSEKKEGKETAALKKAPSAEKKEKKAKKGKKGKKNRK